MTQFYAYVHARPGTVSASGIFYIGKGQEGRYKDFGKKQRNRYHQAVVSKNGLDSILVSKVECSSEQIAFDLEVGLIKCLRRMGVKLTNLSDGGEGASGATKSKETRQLMSEKAKGRLISEETRDKIRKTLTGRKLGKRHSSVGEKISAALKGKKKSLEHCKNLTLSKLGKPSHPQTAETRAKISATKQAKKAKLNA